MKKLITLLVILIGATVTSGSDGSWEETTVTGNNKETKIITRVFVKDGRNKKEITTTVTKKRNEEATVKTDVKKVKKFKSVKVVPNGKKKKKTKNNTYKK